jgi:hypothetical protein
MCATLCTGKPAGKKKGGKKGKKEGGKRGGDKKAKAEGKKGGKKGKKGKDPTVSHRTICILSAAPCNCLAPRAQALLWLACTSTPAEQFALA